MDAGLPGVEFETHGRIASAVARKGGNRASSGQKQRISAFLARFLQLGRVKSDRLLGSFGETEKEKIQVAACFHDIGIWTAGTLDYLSPSEADAAAYLNARGKALWIAEVSEMIEMHHSIRSHAGSPYPLVEPFRRADIADFSLGMVPMGISRELIATLKVAFPNSGFHKRLAQLGSKWFLRHPLNPLPMFRR